MSSYPDTVKVLPGATSVSAQPSERMIGALLMDAGKIQPEAAERILNYQREHGMRFGDAAVKLGIVTEQDIQQVLSKQFDYPYVIPGETAVSSEVVAALSPFSRQVEALRALRSQLLLRWFDGSEDRRCLSIVSAGRKDGRTYLAANLAVVFSQLGERTLLIDADLRAPRQHDLFGLDNSKGLSGILAGRTGLDVVQRVPAFMDLSVLCAGPTPPNPSELLGRASFTQLLAEANKRYDVILIDTSAVALGSDAQTIAVRAGAALVVADKNQTRMDDVAGVVGALTSTHVSVVGTVLNDA